jgi:hypothetical protein
MKSLHFELRWNKWKANWKDGQPVYNPMVKLVTYKFDEVSLPPGIIETETVSNVQDLDGEQRIIVDIKIKCTAKPLRGTFRVLTLTFEKLDPWACGFQPKYTYTQPHTWTPENATCKFWFQNGYFDVLCPELCNIYFGEEYPKVKYSFPIGNGNWPSRVTAGLSNATWNSKIKVTPCTSAWLYVDNGVYDWAGFRIPVDIALKDLYELKFWEYIWRNYAAIPYDVNVILGLDLDGDGKCSVDLPKWHQGPAPGTHHTLALLKGDTFVEMDGQTVLSPPATPSHPQLDWTYINALTGKWWTPNVLGTLQAKSSGWPSGFYGTYAEFLTFLGETGQDSLIPNTDVKIKFIEFVIGGSGSWINTNAYVDVPKINGKYYEKDVTSKWYDTTLYKLLPCNPKIVNLYTFVPIPGDLNRDGIVDIVDLMIIASMYGKDNKYYNFDNSLGDTIDIYDIVIVAKNFGRTTP